MVYFSIHELSLSYTALAKKIPNEPPPQARDALEALAENVLDPLRKAFGRPIYVNSGYRSPTLNRAVGGAAHSQHTSGEAADITSGSRTLNRKLFDLIISLGLPLRPANRRIRLQMDTCEPLAAQS